MEAPDLGIHEQILEVSSGEKDKGADGKPLNEFGFTLDKVITQKEIDAIKVMTLVSSVAKMSGNPNMNAWDEFQQRHSAEIQEMMKEYADSLSLIHI